MKKVSVIVPVYNGERFLHQCVADLASQTYENLEMIMVDDGSCDESLKILRDLQMQLGAARLRIIRQENGGICKARNAGLSRAEGDYILFMDQDDRMHKQAVQTLVSVLESEDADLAIGGYDLIDENGKILKKTQLNPSSSWSKFKISAPWGRVFKKKILDTYGIRFMDTKISEDFYFNLVYMSYCESIAVTAYKGYGWTYRKESESHANMSKASEERDVLRVLEKTIEDMHHPNTLYQQEVDYMMIKHIVWYLYYVAVSVSKEEMEEIYRRCMDWLKVHIPDYRKNKLLYAHLPKGEETSVRTVVAVSMQLEKRGKLLPALSAYRRLKGAK